MAVRSAVLAHGQAVLGANGNVTLATVPAGETWIVKSVVIFIQAAGAPAEVRYGIDSAGVRVDLLRAAAAVLNDLLRIGQEDWHVAAAGAALRIVNPGGAVTVRYHVSGAKLV